jgi:hypothetical protein
MRMPSCNNRNGQNFYTQGHRDGKTPSGAAFDPLCKDMGRAAGLFGPNEQDYP